MSFVSIVPEILSAAADNLQSVGSRIQAQNTAALARPQVWSLPPPTRYRP